MTKRREVLRAMGATLASLAGGCGKRPDGHARIDAEWHRRALIDGLLLRWLQVAPAPSGFMRTAFDRQWRPLADQPGYLTEQSRLVFSLAIGYDVTKDRRFLDAADRGTDFLLTRFRDPVYGGFFLRVSPDGKAIAERKNTYGHAFALLALSHMFRVSGSDRYRKAALLAWSEIDAFLRHPKGGFRGGSPREFAKAQANDGSSQNPLMHLFEALLALHDATQDPAALAGAKGLADFVVYRLLVGTSDGGAYIPEWYDPDWKPLAAGGTGGNIDIGHQFEWVHMLLAAEQRGLGGLYGQVSQRLLKFAIKIGYDDAEGGVFRETHANFRVDRTKYWWPQCEAIRAFLAVASEGDESAAWRRYEETLGLVRTQFIDEANGGWHSKACNGGSCADAQVEPYHMAGMHYAALERAAASK